jgi:hypothetical protein
MKGTPADPLSVITMSNTPYPVASTIPNHSALYRRRQLNIYMVLAPDVRMASQNNVDFSVYTDE